jgi:hypothetical protein
MPSSGNLAIPLDQRSDGRGEQFLALITEAGRRLACPSTVIA